MARTTKRTTKPAVTKPATVEVTKNSTTSEVAYAARGLIDTQGDGVLGELAVGWTSYGELAPERAENFQRRKAAFLANKRAALAK